MIRRCSELRGHAEREHDPLWPMPLWNGYDEDLTSKIADVNNMASHAFAGDRRGTFPAPLRDPSPRWIHIDLYARNARAPRPADGRRAQCIRALYRFIRSRFG